MSHRTLSRKNLSGIVAGIGLLIGVTSGTVAAQMPSEMPAHQPETTHQFRAIEQPLWLKGTVTVAGLALIGLEVWWFLCSQPTSSQASMTQGTQEHSVTVEQNSGDQNSGKKPALASSTPLSRRS
jgi:plastocyanin domain-containing protein